MYIYNVPEKICRIQLSLPHYMWNFEVFWWFFFFFLHPYVLVSSCPNPWSTHFLFPCFRILQASLVAQTVKNLPAMQESRVWSLSREDPWRRTWQTHSSIFAWRIPWTEGAWWATVHGVSKRWKWLKDKHFQSSQHSSLGSHQQWIRVDTQV